MVIIQFLNNVEDPSPLFYDPPPRGSSVNFTETWQEKLPGQQDYFESTIGGSFNLAGMPPVLPYTDLLISK